MNKPSFKGFLVQLEIDCDDKADPRVGSINLIGGIYASF